MRPASYLSIQYCSDPGKGLPANHLFTFLTNRRNMEQLSITDALLTNLWRFDTFTRPHSVFDDEDRAGPA